jgi:hypothetical protein
MRMTMMSIPRVGYGKKVKNGLVKEIAAAPLNFFTSNADPSLIVVLKEKPKPAVRHAFQYNDESMNQVLFLKRPQCSVNITSSIVVTNRIHVSNNPLSSFRSSALAPLHPMV